MNILVINAGSSSLKYQLIDMKTEKCLAKGNCEKIGIDGVINHTTCDGVVYCNNEDFKTHKQAFDNVINLLTDIEYGVIKSIQNIDAVGHRIVQGASKFRESVIVTKEVLADIAEISCLAPLHNPAHIIGIKACIDILGKNTPQVAVFDTAFHSTIPKKAHVYGLPYKYYEHYKVRKYGFHGTSHKYVSGKCAKMMGEDIDKLKIITCHLGNGASISAVNKGKCVDTSMGFTPMDGLLMGTRCGSIDPSIIPYIAEKDGLTIKEIDAMLNKQSGYLGISGIGSDYRDLNAAIENGNRRAKLALDIQNYQIKKYIGAYTAAMNGVDAIVFTGGIGEHSVNTRREACSRMDFLGIEIDEYKNKKAVTGKATLISSANSRVKVFVIPTNEELVIAKETMDLINKNRKNYKRIY